MGSAIHYVALIGFLAFLSAGAILVLLGVRGRMVLDVPRCARCRHQIAGAEFHRSGLCPECGGDLTGTDAISYFVSRRRRGMIALGVAVGALCVVFPVVDRLVTIGARVSVSTNATNVELSGLIGNAPQGETSAVEEAVRRSAANRLSADEYAALVEAIIVRQERLQDDWLEFAETTFLRDAASAGHPLTQAQIDRLAIAGFGAPASELPTKIRENASLNMTPAWEQRRDLVRTLTLREVRLDGRPLRIVDYQGNTLDGLSSTQQGEVVFQHSPGRYRVVSTFDVAASFSPSPGGIAVGSLAGAPTHKVTDERDVEIVSTDAPSWIALRSPSSRAAEVRAACDVCAVAIDSDGGAERRCTLHVDLTPGMVPQLAISFSVVVVVDGVKYDAGWFYAISSTKSTISSSSLNPVELPCPATMPATVRIIARPNPRAVEKYASVDAIWGEDLVFDAVPVTSGRTSEGARR